MVDIIIVIRGTRVAIKRVNLHQVSLNRHMLIELKVIKDLQHDNLVRFYGACMDPIYPVLVTEYCPRGSLQVRNKLSKGEKALIFNLSQQC